VGRLDALAGSPHPEHPVPEAAPRPATPSGYHEIIPTNAVRGVFTVRAARARPSDVLPHLRLAQLEPRNMKGLAMEDGPRVGRRPPRICEAGDLLHRRNILDPKRNQVQACTYYVKMAQGGWCGGWGTHILGIKGPWPGLCKTVRGPTALVKALRR